ncbi:MAG: indole-3-glycerol phosphate synthase TrpC [Pseudomonadota bacterium]|nr:indole-3-glycerol phosphate synthase TrpC [Pseudomonadota bacterium]
MPTILADILEVKRADIARAKAARSMNEMVRDTARAPAPRDFMASLHGAIAAGDVALICEIKRASPSRGVIRADFDPVKLAQSYAKGGAACLSVLTEEAHFKGHPDHLVAARAACDLPVLRKDFIIDPYQIFESRAMGADAILLILAAIDDGSAHELESLAIEQGLTVLAEVHDSHEMTRALKMRTDLIGINNRDLKSLHIDLGTTEELVPQAPPDKLIVAESGIRTRADIDRLAGAGAGAFLIGESLMRANDPKVQLRILRNKEK